MADTVYDRYKKTGFLMGSGHKFGAALNMKPKAPGGILGGPGGMMDKEPDASDPNEASEDEPPSLRDSIDSGECCGVCANFSSNEDGEPSCEKFNGYPVTANQVCDVFESKTPDDAKEMLDQPQGDVRNDAAMQGA